MKGLGRTTVMISALVLPIALADPAPAGGSLLRVSPRTVVRQGSQIRLTGTFCEGAQASVGPGPWFAYLDADGSKQIFVGRIGISENHGNHCEWRVRATLGCRSPLQDLSAAGVRSPMHAGRG